MAQGSGRLWPVVIREVGRIFPRCSTISGTPLPPLSPLSHLLITRDQSRHHQHFRTSTTSANIPRRSSRKWYGTKLLCATAGSCLFIGFSLQPPAFCSSYRQSSSVVSSSSNRQSSSVVSSVHKIPKMTFYQYRTCPFCCKARAYLDYYRIPYTVVEVNPLFKKEIKFSKYKKVPFIVTEDGLQLTDSTLIISVLQTFLCNGGREKLSEVLEKYPEMSYTDQEGKVRTERTNQYFIMFGERGNTEGISLAERREEREWREWVDTKLIHALSPNIYRTFSEAMESFDYISRVGNFSSLERFAAKYVGALSMYLLSKRLKKKYQLKDDVRESLYGFCREWMDAIGKERKFMGGDAPNLADLAVYGVLSSIEGLPAFEDTILLTNLGSWYWPMKKLVNGTGET